MTNFLWLLKINLSNLLPSKGKRANTIRNKSTIVLIAVLFVALVCALGVVFSIMFADILSLSSGIHRLVPLVIGFSAIVCFIFSFYSVGNDLYGFKDYQLLSSMPIKKSTIIFSKLFTSLAFDGIVSLLFTVSALVYLAVCGLVIPYTYCLFATLLSLFTPFIIVAVSSLISFLAAFLSSRFKNKSLAKTIIFTLFFLVIMGGYIYVSFVSEYAIIGIVDNVFFLMPWVENGLNNGLFTLLYCGVAFASFALIFGLICLFYERIYKGVNSIITVRKFKYKQDKQNSQSIALLKKELKTLISNPTYMVNTILGPVMSIAFAVILGVVLKDLEELTLDVLYLIVPPIFSFCFLMAPSTTSSISLEGKAFWILKTSPIKTKKILNIKLLVNIIVGFIPALLSGIVIAVILGGVLEGILIVLLSVSMVIFGGNIGLILNLLFPKFNWSNEKQVVKQSLAVFIQTMIAVAISGLLVGVIFLIKEPNVKLYLIIMASIFIILSAVSYILIALKGEYLLNKKSAS